ncbi:hypothetical protein [Campylobacter corcagiensis]|uniref:Uncharacterized protein n=1 Tax=Campylobacter corcagiensis TaxID=1448857 RepID=A0A7M1LH91_9BACT|nr:hypothetical protein [Campylobacter corcagiensis]QKF64114.1 putative membrane protein [Campylobacter corcagiensis]QOQ87691.1 hypothetical protein IMC76_02445 [Campylobacter corcagiensis]
MKAIREEIKEELKDTSRKIDKNINKAKDEVNNSANNALKKAEDAFYKAQESTKDYVTILGIFAAIVVTFTGAFSINKDLFANISNISSIKILLFVLTNGCLTFNILVCLYNFILKINIKKDQELLKTNKINFYLVIAIMANLMVLLVDEDYINTDSLNFIVYTIVLVVILFLIYSLYSLFKNIKQILVKLYLKFIS